MGKWVRGLSQNPNTAADAGGRECIRKCIRETFELPGLKCVTGCIVYHTVTRCINFEDSTLVNAGYGITIRYLDQDECEKSITREGAVLFFRLPADFCSRNYVVYFPTPKHIKVCDFTATVEFGAFLCVDD
ncbi:hypothetical protein [Caproiciproducens sp. LBM24188]|nr:hypothetical protein [Oscillospiraceae bacterium]HHV32829.1 hypothetical protein [Clostridiales bacterium]